MRSNICDIIALMLKLPAISCLLLCLDVWLLLMISIYSIFHNNYKFFHILILFSFLLTLGMLRYRLETLQWRRSKLNSVNIRILIHRIEVKISEVISLQWKLIRANLFFKDIRVIIATTAIPICVILILDRFSRGKRFSVLCH